MKARLRFRTPGINRHDCRRARQELTIRKTWSVLWTVMSATSKSIGIQIQRPPAFKPGTMILPADTITNGAGIENSVQAQLLSTALVRYPRD